jgi:hypothetical protein
LSLPHPAIRTIASKPTKKNRVTGKPLSSRSPLSSRDEQPIVQVQHHAVVIHFSAVLGNLERESGFGGANVL